MPQGGDKPEPRGSTCCPGAHRAVLGLALRRVRPPRLLGGPCLSNRHDDVLGKCGRVCGFKAHAQPSLAAACISKLKDTRIGHRLFSRS